MSRRGGVFPCMPGLAMTLLALVLVSAPALAQASRDSLGATADSSLARYLQSLRDSTDLYFAGSAPPVDTTGLDSAQAFAFAHPGRHYQSHRLSLGAWPWVGFNRVDGPRYGAGASFGRRGWIGEFTGKVAYAVGPDTWLGSGRWDKWLREGTRRWKFSIEAGRLTALMNRDRVDPYFSELQGFLTGNDTQRYLRRDGLEAAVAVAHPAWRGAVTFRDQLESPLPVTASWSLTDDPLTVPDNLPATRARVHELGYSLAMRVPLTNFTAEGGYWSSSHSIGSSLEYRRARVALGGDIGLGRWFALIPQAAYGHATGEAVPQEAFFLGGTTSLRSIHGDTYGGTGVALARLDLYEMPDILEVLHLPHPAMTPIQLAAFVATGSVWGTDPYGGPPREGGDWPDKDDFIGDAGVSVLYRPGLPDPAAYLKINWGWRLGPGGGNYLVSVAYSHAVDLVRRVAADDDQ